MKKRKITLKRVERAVKGSMFGLDNDGFCLACGARQGGCEPDARGYRCENCGAMKVYGAEEIMMMGAYE